MGTQDVISVPGPGDLGGVSEDNQLRKADELAVVESSPSKHESGEGATGWEDLGVEEGGIGTEECTAGGENSGKGCVGTEESMADVCVISKGHDSNGNNLVVGEVGIEEGQIVGDMEVGMDLVDSPVRQVNLEVASMVTISSEVNAAGCLKAGNESLISNQIVYGGPVSGFKRASGIKRARITYEEQQPSVHISYSCLTRASKRKLEELLQQWSEWHAQHGSSSQDLNEVLESGENTYFPAIFVGAEKPSAVSFWIENQTAGQQSNAIDSPDGNSIPFYDRGYAQGLTSEDSRSNVEGGLEIVEDAARCFNCGAYNHSLKECPKPRDYVAVNNARKLHKLKKVQNLGSRNGSRYYQNSTGGKYEGLKPGALDTETRKLLGLGELDPPPWLNRMRELGYPPGYLDPDEDAQPSGITIFGDEEAKQEEEDGEITEMVCTEPKKKMSVEFPGINAPIPENADEKLWAATTSGSDPFRNQSNCRLNHFSESFSRAHHHEQRWSRDLMDDGPPGVTPPRVDYVLSPSTSSYPPRYGSYDSRYRYNNPKDLPPTSSHSHSDRDRRSTVVYEGFACHDLYNSSPYSSSSRKYGNGSGRRAYESDGVSDDYGRDYSSRSGYEYDRHHHRSRR